jgi:hypothetical protein
MFLFDPLGVIESTPSSGSRSGSFYMGYVDFSVAPVYSLAHCWDPPILFTAEPDSALASLANGVFINWTAMYGELSSATGWVSVFSPYFQESEYPSVTEADVVAYSGSPAFPDTYLSSTGKVDICNGHIDLSLDATPNFSPHLGETNMIVIAATLHNCTHNVTPGEGCTFEIELMRETTNGWQHVAWLDADPDTVGKQNAFTITNGWQGTTLLWDGIATEDAAQATSPDVFTQGTQPFNRIFPAVTSSKPLPPPFYTIFTRIRKNDAIYAEASQNIYIPQVVKIQWNNDVVALLASPDYYPVPPDPPEATLYAGTNTESIVEMLQALPELVSSVYPSGVNIRFTTSNISSDSSKVVTIKTNAPIGKTCVGKSFSGVALFPNRSPDGVAEVYITQMRDGIRLSCALSMGTTNNSKYLSYPLYSQHYGNYIANTVIHEVGHELGLVMPKYLHSSIYYHNSSTNQFAIMQSKAHTKSYCYPDNSFFWFSLEREYLRFILPTADE